MPRKTGLIISWNWTRGYGIVQEQGPTVYDEGGLIMAMTDEMKQYDDAEVLEVINPQQIKVLFKTSNKQQIVHPCCIREQPVDSGKQLFVHNASCTPKDKPAKGFDEPIGKDRVWYSLWERGYYNEGPNNSAIKVSHKE